MQSIRIMEPSSRMLAVPDAKTATRSQLKKRVLARMRVGTREA